MLTKNQVICCVKNSYGCYQDKKKLVKELEKSEKEYYTDEEVQKFQMKLARAEHRGYPTNDAEWDAYDSVHHLGSWYSPGETRYDDYNGEYSSIWD